MAVRAERRSGKRPATGSGARDTLSIPPLTTMVLCYRRSGPEQLAPDILGATVNYEEFDHGLELARAAAAAEAEFDCQYERVGGGRSIPPGREFQPVDDEFCAAMEQQSAADAEFQQWMDQWPIKWRFILTPEQLEQILKTRSTHT